MNSVETAQKVDRDVGRMVWTSDSPHLRACSIIAWCESNGVECSVRPEQLMAAMARQKYWCQGPSDYLDMVNSLTAAAKA